RSQRRNSSNNTSTQSFISIFVQLKQYCHDIDRRKFWNTPVSRVYNTLFHEVYKLRLNVDIDLLFLPTDESALLANLTHHFRSSMAISLLVTVELSHVSEIVLCNGRVLLKRGDLVENLGREKDMGQLTKEMWKDANLVPIHKTGRKSQATNYRGISLLEQLSKIFEKGVYNVVFEFFSNKITSQHGFYPRRSCATQLTQVVHLLAQSMDNKQQVDLVYLDFAKAFDRVPHSKLICKLHLLGIRDPLLSWFRSYLYKRRHRVVIDGFASEWLPVTSGVPQGSVLGPLLFLLYINDMPEVISQGSYLPLFADDSKCFRVIFNASDQDRLQEDLNALYDWSIKWGMEFNVEKCKVLRVVRTRTIYDRQYALGSSHLSVVQSEKDLGVWISDTLNWNIHTDNIVAKAQKMLGLLYRTLKDIDDNNVFKHSYFHVDLPDKETCE
ncbi:Hypothetical predicted protein, partial [Paramuricea clavata]